MLRRESGMTVVELLTALTVSLALTVAAASIIISTRRVTVVDQQRTSLNQNLRAGMDLVGIDVRQAAERLPQDMPVIFVTDGSPGTDTLVVRRNISEHVMRLCVDLAAASTVDQVVVALTVGVIPPGCNPVPDTNADGWPDNLESWRDQRLATGGTMAAYIYSPLTKTGEFFPVDDEDDSSFFLHRSDGGAWLQNYDVADQVRIYILEQRTYQVAAGVLQYFENAAAGSPVNLIDGVADFQVRAFFGGVAQDTMTAADNWINLESIEVNLAGQRSALGRTLDRNLSSRFFPRNILSR